MSTTIRNIILGTLVIGLILALVAVVLPIKSVFAAGEDAASLPTDISSADPATTNAKLELAFVREKSILARIGEASNNFNLVTSDMQTLLDKAKSNGKDVSAVQSALDAFKTAFQTGKPYFDQANTILTSQTGFDNLGKVLDVEKAKSTVKSLREILIKYNDSVKISRQSLRNAVRNFRLANPRKNSSATPTVTNP